MARRAAHHPWRIASILGIGVMTALTLRAVFRLAL